MHALSILWAKILFVVFGILTRWEGFIWHQFNKFSLDIKCIGLCCIKSRQINGILLQYIGEAVNKCKIKQTTLCGDKRAPQFRQNSKEINCWTLVKVQPEIETSSSIACQDSRNATTLLLLDIVIQYNCLCK